MRTILSAAVTLVIVCATVAAADEPAWLRDRGPGTPVSMFGTYIEKGELIVYPFYEYYINKDEEYAPNELGFDLDEDFRGEYEAHEGLIFLGYGITEDIALEVEVAVISATLKTADNDPTETPDEISESGHGDTQMQLNWRWARETESRPAVFSFAEVVFPFQEDDLIIGTQDWEVKVGSGVIRGFGFGTMTLRAAVEYDAAEEVVEFGEIAVEYLRRLNDHVRIYLGVEGNQDEWEEINEVQLHFNEHVFVKLNSAFGVTSKAVDWAPETGIVLRF